jgi:hypothetical protein
MEAQFKRDWAAGTAIDQATWANRPLFDRVGDWGARALEGLL